MDHIKNETFILKNSGIEIKNYKKACFTCNPHDSNFSREKVTIVHFIKLSFEIKFDGHWYLMTILLMIIHEDLQNNPMKVRNIVM